MAHSKWHVCFCIFTLVLIFSLIIKENKQNIVGSEKISCIYCFMYNLEAAIALYILLKITRIQKKMYIHVCIFFNEEFLFLPKNTGCHKMKGNTCGHVLPLPKIPYKCIKHTCM